MNEAFADIPISPEAQRARHSPLEDIFRRMTRFGPHIALAAGSPPSDAIPLERWHECFDSVLTEQGTAALQYQMPNPGLREWLADWMQRLGVACQPEQIFLTNGNQQGLQLASRLLLASGQAALIERPAYTGILDVTQKRGIEVQSVALHPKYGLDLAQWREVCSADPRPAAAFAVLDFHNPTGFRADGNIRAQLAEIAGSTGVPIIEDDAYSALRISGDSLPSLRAYPGGESCIYLGTFSKMLFPALRLGWVVAPVAWLPMLNGLRQTVDLQSSAIMTAVAAEFLRRGWLDEHLERLRHLLRERLAVFQEALRQSFGDHGEWEEPQGGLFLWLRLPEEVDADARFDEALAQGVSYVPGNHFYDDGETGKNELRLSFASAAPKDLRVAVQILARVLLPTKKLG
ncbi:MAG: PLP-dependent aminotransferase family protein [Chloroflexi bacterium]|nr:PLP-dependent aminotransferase family protein [Chloroflexota bacterium]